MCQEAEQCNIPGGRVGLPGEGIQKCSACISNLSSIDYSTEQPYHATSDIDRTICGMLETFWRNQMVQLECCSLVPVIRTASSVADGGVFFVADQPMEGRVIAQADPGQRAHWDVGTTCIQVSQHHHILLRWGRKEDWKHCWLI